MLRRFASLVESVNGRTGKRSARRSRHCALDVCEPRLALTSGYLQVNLVSDQPGNALVTDPNLINPWGVSFSPTSPFWVSDNGANVASVYSGDVNGSPFANAGLVVSIPRGNPTGMVANGTNDFMLGTSGASAKFIFASESGDILGWNPAASATQSLITDSVPGAVYKGLALANNGTANELFVTNFAAGTIDVFNSSFQQVTLPTGAFTDPNLPTGFAPFGIDLLNGKLFVSYAKQDSTKHDDVAGFGNGFIDEYSLDGTLLQRLVTGSPGDPTSPLNSPWGMAIAPANFGDFGGDLLVGNFGDGKINAFDPNNGTFLGTLSDASGNPIVINGLWTVTFGNGAAAGSTNTLYFTAGSDGEQHGLFGALVSTENTPLAGEGAKLGATEATAFRGTVAAFSSSNTSAPASAFTATINWGDGSTSAGTVASNGDGGFNVNGNHTYADEAATETIQVTVSDGTNTVTLDGGATVKDAPLTVTGVPVTLRQGLALTNVSVATFTDAAPEPATNYTASINWGDGTTTSAGTISDSGNTLTVTGSHTFATDGEYQITVTINDEGGATATATTTAQAGYLQVNLAGDLPGNGLITDPNLVNPWGIAYSPNGPFWIADNNADVATVYSGNVNGSPLANAGLVVSLSGGNPTGIVANTTSDFVVGSGSASGPAKFIFASEGGTITGWNSTVSPTQGQIAVTVPRAVYKGLVLANNGTANELFATNFAAGTIDVFNGSFQQVTLPTGAFTDPNLPAGFAPFGIDLLNGNLYVSYALQDADKHDNVIGPGNGFIDVYSLGGTLEQRLVTGQPGDPFSPLNSPWGMVIAPANFGDLGGDLLVGNFGDGRINAFDPNNGTFLGTLNDASGNPIVIHGLWSLVFGNGSGAGNTSTLFFTAGINGEVDGLFGSLTSALNTPLTGDGAVIGPTEGAAFSGAVAAFASNMVSPQAADFTATIDWGGGSTSAGTVVANPEGGFNVVGSHTYAQATTETIQVTIADNTSHTITIAASAAVTAATPALTISQTGPTAGQPDTPLTYTITVANTGGAVATGAVVIDILPAGLTNITATDAAGTVNVSANTIADTLGALEATNGTETLTITATPDQSLNGAVVTSTATLSFNGTAQTASATTTIGTVTPPAPTGVGFLAGMPGDGTPQTFVQNLYQELLGREPDSTGSNFWVTYLDQNNNPAARQQVIAAFMNSAEYKVHYVTSLYEIFLGRAPDARGLAFWTAAMGNPGTPGQNSRSADEKFMVAAFFGSDEFFIKSGNTPQGWVNALYEAVFGREADGPGLAFWMNELSVRGPGDRDGIVRDLLSTPEAEHDVLDSFYPASGGMAGHPLAAAGSQAGTGLTDLGLLTGAGWENLYLDGPFDNTPEANDSFFASLNGGGKWDDVQLSILDTDQFYADALS